ncbi:VOC family protein [Nocardia macrotermitis]|uniref:Manganese-dependent 2,3-dihydroxybiphenyl 1,2-dioxygenase n=1 Tax=Nocardia macrotermitis TaxID=2585198 RepID=A0A7K0D793_9NOCA|nr:VOC family protein [Nocardia macrotermitis]MQY21577.1 Manganese-dependent 2,3-dihydroxybiphenyl 1,2-dioxygenase [Nocardia macrotermitis]
MAGSRDYDPGPQIAHAAGINLGTPDLERSLKFYRDLLGMEVTAQSDGVAYLRGYQELTHHSLVLTQQAQAQVNTYSFRVRRPEDVELFHKQLTESDVEVLELPAGHETGRGTAIRFLIPGGEHPVELYYDIDKPLAPEELRSKLPTNSSRRRGWGVRRLDHLNVQTGPSTVNQAEGWLREALGFKRREYIMVPQAPQTVMASWLSVTHQSHDIAIGISPDETNGRFHHVAFNIENYSDVLRIADELKDIDIEFGAGPGKHGIGQAMYLYIHDPGSGHRVELYSGGYQIMDPDFPEIEWTPLEAEYGQTWYGNVLDVGPGAKFLETTPSAGLRA